MFRALRNRVRDARTLATLMQGADIDAGLLGAALPGPEHVAISAARLSDGTAAAAWRAVGVDPTGLLDELRELAALDDASDAITSDAPTDLPARAFRATAPAQLVLRRLNELAGAGRGELRSAHVLVAAAVVTDGTWPRLLAHLGTTQAALTAAAEGTLRSGHELS